MSVEGIENRVIDGVKATVTYIKAGMEICKPEEAELIKIVYADGRCEFAYPVKPEIEKLTGTNKLT